MTDFLNRPKSFTADELSSSCERKRTNATAMSHNIPYYFRLAQKMTSMYMKSIPNAESPRGRQQYTLLHSPKSGIVYPKVPFLVILSLGFGFFIGGTWNKISARTDPCTKTIRDIESIDNKQLRKQAGNGSLSVAWDDSAMRDYSQLRTSTSNTSLSIAWLMSFPVRLPL